MAASPFRPSTAHGYASSSAVLDKDPISDADVWETLMDDPMVKAALQAREAKKRKEREVLNNVPHQYAQSAPVAGQSAQVFVPPKPAFNPAAAIPLPAPPTPSVGSGSTVVMSMEPLPGVHELLYYPISTSIADSLPLNPPIVGTGLWTDLKNRVHFVLVSDLLYTDDSGHEKIVIFKMFDKSNGDEWKKKNSANRFTVRQR